MELREVFQAELMANEINLCTGCDNGKSHARGYAVYFLRIIHLDRAIATRSTLFRALHEVGHIVKKHVMGKQRRFIMEAEANRYAADTMRALGISVPRKVTQGAHGYVARMKRWGNNISKGRR